jgi:DNA-binding protein
MRIAARLLRQGLLFLYLHILVCTLAMLPKSQKAGVQMSSEQNVIFVGNKPPMNYVMAVITGFNMSNSDAVVLKARGRAISTAVDVAEIVRNRFFKDAKVHSIAIGSEQITPREGGNPRNVSTMEITLKKE